LVRIPSWSITERAVHGASMPLAPRLWLNIPNALARSRRIGLKALSFYSFSFNCRIWFQNRSGQAACSGNFLPLALPFSFCMIRFPF
jgi:hypothetical protein